MLLLALIVQMRRRNRALHELNNTLERLAHFDPLTGLHNRRAIEHSLDVAIEAATRHGHPLSVILLDIDHFKQINDTLGHHVGDQALRSIAEALARTIRTIDVLGRWGGEEFLAVLGFTDEHGAELVAERLRLAVASTVADGRRLTITLGVAQWQGETVQELLQRADRALYLGKIEGRNRVRVAGRERRLLTGSSPEPEQDPARSAA